MIGLKKKQLFSLENTLMVDFALPLNEKQKAIDVQQRRLQALIGLGVEHVVLTTEPISASLSDYYVKARNDKFLLPSLEGLSTEVVPSYWLDDGLETYVKQHALVTYREKYVLLVLRNFNSVRLLKSPLFEIRARGYEPIILHQDSSQYIRLRGGAVEYLSDLGCLFHLDLLSLAGAHGTQAKGKAETLVSSGRVGVLTTGVRTAEDCVQLRELLISTSLASALQQTIKQHLLYLGVAK